MGSKLQTFFYKDPWARSIPLKNRLHRLFNISNQPDELVEEIGRWIGGNLIWDMRWRRRLFLLELRVVNRLHFILGGFIIFMDKNKWIWIYSRDDIFFVTCAYPTQLDLNHSSSFSSHFFLLRIRPFSSTRLVVLLLILWSFPDNSCKIDFHLEKICLNRGWV